MSSAEGLQYMLSIESVENICRICFYEEGSTSLFATAVHEGVELNIQEVLETIIKTQIDENDNLPKYVCENCFILLLKTYKFINNCLQSNETLQCFKSLRNQVDFVKEEVQMEQFDDVENSIEVFKEESTSPNREENATLQCDVEKPVVPSYSCYVCSKSCKSKTALKRHCTSHTGKKPFKCKLCFIGFSSVSNLARHRKVHSGEKPYKCDICPKDIQDSASDSDPDYRPSEEEDTDSEQLSESENQERLSCDQTTVTDNSSPINSSGSKSNLVIADVRSIKSLKRKHNCIYCDVLVNNFGRHLERQHRGEVQVQKFLALAKKDPARKQLIDKIRKEGDFCSGEFISVQNRRKVHIVSDCSVNTKDEGACQLLPCIHCKGYYAKKTLRKHVKRCYFNDKGTSKRSRPQAEGHTLMANNFGLNDPLCLSGLLNGLKADDVALVAKRDKVICEVARRYVKSHNEKHLIIVAKRYMRRLARLLMQVRTIENNKLLTMQSILHPSKFQSIVQATRTICEYNNTTKLFKSPSMALQMGSLLKKAIDAAYAIETQKNFDTSEAKMLTDMKKLIEEKWALEISVEAGPNLNLNKFNQPTLMPTAEDIHKMKTYLDELIFKAKMTLQENSTSEEAYKKLIEGTYCSLMLFNKRRMGELQRIFLETYKKVLTSEQSAGEFEKLLSPVEKILIKNLKRVIIRGKRGWEVPVLFDKITQEGLDLAIQHRHNFFDTPNPYLFGMCHTENHISGYHVFRKHVRIAVGDQQKCITLTSTKLRKHLATILQILKMENNDLEELASFMGHTQKTHEEWYRLPSDIYQTAKVSKLLIKAQTNEIDEYKGCNINDINIDMDTIETEQLSDMEDGIEVQNDLETENANKGDQITTSTLQRKKRILKKWTPVEKEVTEKFFRNHIKNKIPPKKNEVLNLCEQYPLLFKNRKWDSIKVYICNIYSKK